MLLLSSVYKVCVVAWLGLHCLVVVWCLVYCCNLSSVVYIVLLLSMSWNIVLLSSGVVYIAIFLSSVVYIVLLLLGLGYIAFSLLSLVYIALVLPFSLH